MSLQLLETVPHIDLVKFNSQFGSLRSEQEGLALLEVVLFEAEFGLLDQNFRHARGIIALSHPLGTGPVLVVDVPETHKCGNYSPTTPYGFFSLTPNTLNFQFYRKGLRVKGCLESRSVILDLNTRCLSTLLYKKHILG